MAIAPIDLQTLFSQVDKVGRTQMAQKEAQTIQQAVQNIQLQIKTEEKINQVNEAQDTGDGTEKVKDREGNQQKRQNDGKKNKSELNDEEDQASFLRDPSLGRNIDISL